MADGGVVIGRVSVKVCKDCGVERGREDFYVGQSGKGLGRLSTYCRECTKARMRKNPEGWREANRSALAARTEKECPRCVTVKPLTDFSRSADRVDGRSGWCCACYADSRRERADYYRDYEYRRRYGITGETYDAMLAAQEGRCAICGTTECPTGRALCVDHNHTTGAVRAILCSRCNHAIGLLDESQERLQAAAEYLRRHNG